MLGAAPRTSGLATTSSRISGISERLGLVFIAKGYVITFLYIEISEVEGV